MFKYKSLKRIFLIVFCICFFIFVGCNNNTNQKERQQNGETTSNVVTEYTIQNEPQNTMDNPSSTTEPGDSTDLPIFQQNRPSSGEASKYMTDLPSINDMGYRIKPEDIGVTGISALDGYWSPGNNYYMFTAFKKDGQNQYTISIFIHHVKDRQTQKILEISNNSNVVLFEPSWSQDESLAAVSYYSWNNIQHYYCIQLYDILKGNLTAITDNGMDPSISSDKSKIVYVNEETRMKIYHIADGRTEELPKAIRGISPVWYSDNKHILLLKYTGMNPSGLEGADLMDLCIVDTSNYKMIQLFEYGKTFRGSNWIIPDRFLWIYSGWDDGHYLDLFDVEQNRLVEIGEAMENHIFYDEAIKIFHYNSELHGYQWMDHQQNILGFYRTEGSFNDGFSILLCHLHGGRLMYYRATGTQDKGCILMSSLDSTDPVQVSSFETYFHTEVSYDGSMIAFVNDVNHTMQIVEAKELAEFLSR